MLDERFWNRPEFLGMDPKKLEFIMSFANQEKPKKMNQAMPFLMSQLGLAKKQNINFTKPEVTLICEILSRDLPPEEQEKVKKVLSMIQSGH